ncbi:MAG: hypothetical protein Q7U53_08240 [Anaerolineaceae bacterium]|nr:hypothetical protein [Anaerolineaceae bacterium]
MQQRKQLFLFHKKVFDNKNPPIGGKFTPGRVNFPFREGMIELN